MDPTNLIAIISAAIISATTNGTTPLLTELDEIRCEVIETNWSDNATSTEVQGIQVALPATERYAFVERVQYRILRFKWNGEQYQVEKKSVVERQLRVWKRNNEWEEVKNDKQ